MKSRHTLAFGVALLLMPACDNGSTDEPSAPRQAQVQQASPADDSNSMTPFALGADWRLSVDDAVARLRAQEPQLAEALYAMGPRTTRAGTARFTGPLVRRPIAAAVFLDRLTAGGDVSSEVRAALVEALPRTTGPFGPAVIALLAQESDARVRVAMVASLRTADAPSALAGLELGLHDSDAAVRMAAARTATRRTDGAELEAPLLAAAADSDADVKAEAIRSLGVLKIEAAKDLIEAELKADDAALRLSAVRALVRIDPAFAKSRVRSLVADEDPRVAKSARQALEP
ncbi:MAG: HEAT repeat domain-containing protein [Nannocystaceae bacterium]|nr:HEAT repeat domain-containing protein [Nannocystaceae bacterium]